MLETQQSMLKSVAARALSEQIDDQTFSGMIISGRLAGFNIVADARQRLSYWWGNYEREVTREMERYCQEGSVGYDIGAHIGFHSLYLGKLVAETGTVYSFEPSPATRNLLEINSQHSQVKNIIVVPFAVSNSTGTAVFAVGDSFGDHINGESGDKSILVPTISVDDFVSLGALPPSFIKIDVEGHELQVFEGAEETISCHKPVIMSEVSQGSQQGILALMDKHNYGFKTLSKPGSYLAKNGIPNILFYPK